MLRRLTVRGPRRPARAPEGRTAYAGLMPHSELLVDLPRGGGRAVNVVLPQVNAGSSFAGVATALRFAGATARELDLPLRVVTVNTGGARRAGTPAELGARAGVSIRSVHPLGDGGALAVDDADVWVVTYWTTAHAAAVAAATGRIDPLRVLYLVQDYEPGFSPWSVEYALAAATYHAGFHLAVNSAPLAAHLREAEQVRVEPGLTFAPDLALDRLQAVARRRAEAGPADRSGRLQIFFYARPSRPRNLFRLGVAALRLAAGDLGDVDVVTAGEAVGPLRLGPGRSSRDLGNVGGAAGYDDLLAASDVGLSLMLSPHPSHPPLDLAVSGGVALTNDFGELRRGLHPRLRSAAADPQALAGALVAAVAAAREGGPGGYLPPTGLGLPVAEVARAGAALAGR